MPEGPDVPSGYRASSVIVSPGSRGWSLGGGAQDDAAVYVNVMVHSSDDAFMVKRRVIRIPLHVNGDLQVGTVEVLTPEEAYGAEEA